MFAVVLVAVLLIAVFSGLYFSGILLSPFAASPVQFNSAGSTHSYTIDTLSSAPVTILQGGTGQTGATSFTWPIAYLSGSFALTSPPVCFFSLCATNNLGSWLVTLGDNGNGCYAQGSASPVCQTSSYSLSGSLSSPTFLSQSNNPQLWSNEASSINSQNPYSFTVNYTSTANAPKPCTATGTILSTTNQCVVTLYIYRYYVTLDLHTNNAQSISISCYSTCVTPGNYQSSFQSGVQNVLSSVINPSSKLVSTPATPTQISLQLGIPQSAIQNNLQSYGIIGAWTANPSGVSSCNSVGDLCQNSFCGSSTLSAGTGSCQIAQSNIHTALGIWKDPGMTQGAVPVISPQVNVAGYTASQLAQAAFNLSSTVYTQIGITSFGAGFTMSPSCSVTSYATCFQTGNPDATVTILYDIVGAQSSFYSYPSPPGNLGTNSGTLSGQVVDGSLFWHPGVPGAQVCFIGAPGCAPVNTNGNFQLSNVAAGTYTVQVTAPGYFSSSALQAVINTGTNTNMGQISLAELNPWYNGNWCPLQGFGITSICIPWIFVFLGVGAIVALGVAALYIYSPGSKVKLLTNVQRANRLTPNNPLSRAGRGFVSRRIAVLLGEGYRGKQAQAIAFNEARQAGYHVPPKPE